jgi:pyridoxal phosphate enzyme (YggS family)
VDEIAVNLTTVRVTIAAACQRAGRSPSDVTLVAVSKLQPTELIAAAYAAGQRDFGENYAQELRDKAAALASYPDLRWHAIGPLQRNKVKYVAKVAGSFHALDSLEIAEELGKRRSGPPIDVFLEVNIAGEDSKSGIAPSKVAPLADQLRHITGVRLVGLMCMPPQPEPPATWTPEDNRPHFARLRELARSLGLPQLSMGTTADFAVAIEEGATLVRVGRSIFGARKPPARPS